MDKRRTEQVARAVAGVLHISEDYTPCHWDKTKGSTLWRAPVRNASGDRLIWVAYMDGYWCGAEEMLSDMNVARRFKDALVANIPVREEGINLQSPKGLLLQAIHTFCLRAWRDCPAAIEALCVAAGLVPSDPDKEEKTND